MTAPLVAGLVPQQFRRSEPCDAMRRRRARVDHAGPMNERAPGFTPAYVEYLESGRPTPWKAMRAILHRRSGSRSPCFAASMMRRAMISRTIAGFGPYGEGTQW